MKIYCRLVSFLLIGAATLLLFQMLNAQEADKPIRALVVDRSNNFLWLGLPAPVKKGTVFDIMLMPDSKVIARAVVFECTPDEPYVAKAKFVLEDANAFIPVGAYAEASGKVFLNDRDEIPGYRDVKLGSKYAKRINFSIGAFYPLEESLRKETQNILPVFQLSHGLCKSKTGELNLVLGYCQGSGDFSANELAGSRDFKVTSLTFDAKFSDASEHRKLGFYLLAGAGAFWIQDKRTMMSTEQELNVITFGWRSGIGYQSKSGRLAQLMYTDTARSDFKGLVFSLGARF